MSTIDPKWIQYDEAKLTTIVDLEDNSLLSIRDDINLEGVSVEYVNGTRLTVSATEPVEVATPQDIWVSKPAV